MYTVETLDEAISTGRQVSFTYNEYYTDKKLHPRRNSDGDIRKYRINPFQMAAANGRYYLICSNDKYDQAVHYRVDRITDIQLLNTPVKPQTEIAGLERGLNLPTHMAEHLYMFSGESIRVVFRAEKCIINEIMDWFGEDVSFFNETANTVDVSVRVNENAMFYWLMQFGEHAQVLEPSALRQRMRRAAERLLEKY